MQNHMALVFELAWKVYLPSCRNLRSLTFVSDLSKAKDCSNVNLHPPLTRFHWYIDEPQAPCHCTHLRQQASLRMV